MTSVAAVQTRDRFQNDCIVGGDKITATIAGPAGSAAADVKDFGNGKYRVQVRTLLVVACCSLTSAGVLCAVHWSGQGRQLQAVDSAQRPGRQGLAVCRRRRHVAWQVARLFVFFLSFLFLLLCIK